MLTDRYLRVILTLIAVELLWLGLKNVAPPVSAQAAPTSVVITGVQIDGPDSGFLPVAVAGSFRQIPDSYRASLEPHHVRISGSVPIEVRGPLKIEADRPLKIESDRPLKVESVDYTPKSRPGE